MKKIFTIKLDTDITIDFSAWGLSDAEQMGGRETRKLVINHFLDECGIDEFEVAEKNNSSLFDTIAEGVKAQNDYYLAHKNEFENIKEREYFNEQR